MKHEALNEYPTRIGTGLFCHVHLDDVLAGGRITRLGNRLEKAVQLHCGAGFPIVQSCKDIFQDVRWETVMKKAASETCILFPVITPAFFGSESCCQEVLAFSTIKSKIGGLGPIFPIYFVAADLMESESVRSRASARVRDVAALLRVQYEDWRDLRLCSESARAYSDAIDRFAQRVAAALLG